MGSGCSSCGAWWPSGGLVVARWVEGQFAQEFAGCLADDPDVQVLGEDEDLGSGVGAADADVVELAGVAEGDGADGPDLVGADAVVGVGVAVAGGGLGPGGVGGCGGPVTGQGGYGPVTSVLSSTDMLLDLTPLGRQDESVELLHHDRYPVSGSQP